MLKRLFVSSIFIAFSLLVFSQSFRWSEAETLDGFEVSNIYSTTDSTIYVVKQDEDRKNELSFDVFAYDLSKKSSGETTLGVDEINHIAIFNDALHVFGVKYHGKTDELIVFQLDSLGNVLESKRLLECKANGGYHAYFDVRVSPLQNFCAVIGSDGYVPDQKEIIHSILFNNEWEEQHREEIPTSILSQKRSYNVLAVNDNGVTYVMKRERKKSADKYYVFSISKSGTENHHELHLKSRNIMDMRFDLDTVGDLYLAGFYSPPYKNLFEGMYIKKLNQEGVELFSKEYMFNENVITAFNSKKDIKEYGYGLRKFHTNHFGFINEKNLVLEVKHTTRQKTKKGDFEYIQEGFVLISFSSKGGFQYAAPVHLSQTDENHKGYWNSAYHVNFKGENIIYTNILGEGTKDIKEDIPASAYVHIISTRFTDNGVAKRELQAFDVNVANHAVYTKVKNHSILPLLIVKSKDKDQYAIGLLEEAHE